MIRWITIECPSALLLAIVTEEVVIVIEIP